MNDQEIWKPITGFEGYYEVSSHGQVRSVPRPYTKGGILKTAISKKGYVRIKLRIGRNGLSKMLTVHREVAKHFCQDYSESLQVNHIDGNKLNNYYRNLECCTNAENQKHAVENNLHHSTKYAKHESPLCKPIIQLDKNNVFLKEYRSSQEAIELGAALRSCGLSKALTGKIKSQSHNGFRWMYKKDYESKEKDL